MLYLFYLQTLFYRFRAWFRPYVRWAIAYEMVLVSANGLFWGHWATPLADIALNNPGAPHVYAALACALVFKLIAVAGGVRLFVLRKEWVEVGTPRE
ncbi:hypothetical protein [Dyella sp. S184]|uniref:hypothetical protein n=1 Tax=Dyella sp. S184 TaxID=1641862 RepID=UPI00131E26A6|nr:hypothetical protein [Dyella sp. S184]